MVENKNLYGNDFGLDFRFLRRFAIAVNYLNFFEKINNKRDFFTLYAALLKYYRIRAQRVDAWFGLGTTYIVSDVDKVGFTFGVGGEWFVKKPISLLASYKTTLINSKNVNSTKFLLKYHIKKYRIASGYEYYRLGVSKINAFSLGVEMSF